MSKPSEPSSKRDILEAADDEASFLVLVIDDYEPIRRQLQWMLEGLHRVSVACAENGAEGLELMRRKRPTLVVLDLDMPVMDGFEVLDACQADPELKNIPIVVMTATDDATEDAVPRVLLSGATDYLRKPVDASHLRQYIAARVVLAEQEKARRRHDQTLKHNAANPLTAILFFAEMLGEQAESLDRAEIKEFSQQIKEAAERLYDAVEQIVHG